MADPPPDPDSNSDTGDVTRVRPGRGSPPGTPLWVKVFGIIGIVVVLLLVIILVAGRGGGPGGHGPRRHMPSSSVTEYGVQQS